MLIHQPLHSHNELARLKSFHDLCILNSPKDLAFDAITQLASKIFGVPVVAITLTSEGRQWIKSNAGLEVLDTPRYAAFCNYTIRSQEPVVVLDTSEDARFMESPLVTRAPYLRFYAGAPLIHTSGQYLGSLCLFDVNAHSVFSEARLTILLHLAAMVLSCIESSPENYLVDQLTNLPNRAKFIEDLSDWRRRENRHGDSVYAVSIDVCGYEYYQEMNKALGFEYAEGYIIAAKNRLIETLNLFPMYRIGTSLFAFLSDRPNEPSLCETFTQLLSAFADPVEHQAIPHATEVSIGAVKLDASAEPQDIVRGLTIATDIARNQRLDWHLYDNECDATQQRAFTILTRIPLALKSKEQFSLYYQPRIDLLTGKCRGVEALLRWSQPELGEISPADFIPLAEKTALIRRVTHWVLQNGLKQAEDWQQRGYRLTLAINVSAVDLDHVGFPSLLKSLIAAFKIDPGYIEIEFKENAIATNSQRLSHHLQLIKAIGVQISIDDFGSGFSSFNDLKQVPARILKIDQSFIRSLSRSEIDHTIVPAMIDLGHNLGHIVVAEGIESQEIYETVKRWGCDWGQGYWLARPMPIEDFERWLKINHELVP